MTDSSQVQTDAPRWSSSGGGMAESMVAKALDGTLADCHARLFRRKKAFGATTLGTAGALVGRAGVGSTGPFSPMSRWPCQRALRDSISARRRRRR